MTRLIALVVLATASIASAAPSSLLLDTRFVNVPKDVKEADCLARAKTSLTALFKGTVGLDIHAGSHTQIAVTPDVIVQVECLQYTSVSGAYVLAAGTSS